MFKEKLNNKYIAWGLTALAVICAAILFFFLLLKLDKVVQFFGLIVHISAPIIYGAVLAYILRPLYNRFELFLMATSDSGNWKPGRQKQYARCGSTFLTLMVMVFVFYTLVRLILPQLLITIQGIIEAMPDNIKQVSIWTNNILADHPAWEEWVMKFITDTSDRLRLWAETDLIPQLTEVVTNVSLGVINFVGSVFDIAVGLIVCIYVLNSKHRFYQQGRKICFAALPYDYAQTVLQALRYADRVFLGFLSGKLLDSLIIGLLAFICLTFMGMPYVLLISVIVGVTNIIPFFGPFIGAIPSAILILFVDPIQCLYFLIFVLILQQIDGNIIGPKILGSSTGLSSFWVIFAILVGGGLFGFIGMILGVPTFAVFYHFVKYMSERQLRLKGLPTETERYAEDPEEKEDCVF